MHKRFYFFLTFYTLLFLFYPGDSDYFHIFSYNRPLFSRETKPVPSTNTFIPVLKTFSKPDLTAEGVYIVDHDTFTPVYQKNPGKKLFPASTTKILTSLVAFDVYKPDDVITVKRSISEGQVMGLVPGERITVENLLYGTLIHSGNDAAFALADNYGLNKFVLLMNEKAKELKMENSQFKNPAGLDAPGQYTTPFDLALASRALLKNNYLSKIVSIKEIIISDVDFKYFHTLTNVNKLLGEIQGIGGLKTGYTEEAGENLVSLYRRSDGHDFIIVILKSQDRFADTRRAVDWINSNVGYKQIPL